MNFMPKSKKDDMTEVEMLLLVANSALMLASDLSDIVEDEDKAMVAQKWFKVLTNQAIINKLLDELNKSDTIKMSQN